MANTPRFSVEVNAADPKTREPLYKVVDLDMKITLRSGIPYDQALGVVKRQIRSEIAKFTARVEYVQAVDEDGYKRNISREVTRAR